MRGASNTTSAPTHVYLGVVREYLRHGYDVGAIDMAHIANHLTDVGCEVDAAAGTIQLAATP